MNNAMQEGSVFSHFLTITDLRVQGRCDHPLINIIVISVCAILCGAESWMEIEEFGNQRKNWFQKYLDLRNGIPSHDTFSRVFSLINPSEFETAFRSWVESILEEKKITHIALDGKSVRGTEKTINQGLSPLHLVSVFSHEYGLVLSQTQAKSSGTGEAQAALEGLKFTQLNGVLVTVDAGLSIKRITDQIREQKGDYLVPIKGNQKSSLWFLKEIFNQETLSGNETDFASVEEKNRGRREKRECWVLEANSFKKAQAHQWKDVKSVIKIKRTRESKDNRYVIQEKDEEGKCTYKKNMQDRRLTEEVVYYISSRKLKSQDCLKYIRKHWNIENKLHWSLDMVFLEDQWRTREKIAARNLSLVRKIAFNLLQKCPTKGSKRIKMKRAAWNNEYLENLLFKS